MDRSALEAEWLTLTREKLPAVARERVWPIHLDHCFMRVLLDHAFGGVWYRHVEKRPAYKHVPDQFLTLAVATGHEVLAGTANLAAMNEQSLMWRGKADRGTAPATR